MNKKELKYITENYFQEDLNLNLLFKMVSQVISENVDLTQATVTPTEDIDIKLPVIRISEAWGREGNADRAIIEAFTSKIPGETLQKKLEGLNDVLTGAKASTNVSDLLSTMMICEILSVILRDFTEAAGGFIFEGFMAGLFGGKSVQITDPEEIEGMSASGKPITDVILSGTHYSLKLLGPKTGVKGSFKNMVDHFRTIPDITYLDARRVNKTEGLEFGEFKITLRNFLDVFFTPFAKIKKISKTAPTVRTLYNAIDKLATEDEEGNIGSKIFKIKSNLAIGRRSNFTVEQIQQLDEETLNQIAPFTVFYSEESFHGSPKAKYLFGSGRQYNEVADAIESDDEDKIFLALEATPGYQKKRQFELTKKQAESISGFQHIGTLMIGEETMKTVWLNYAKILQEVINPIYGNLQEFTNNVNAYLLGAGDADRKSRGTQAIHDAKQLQTATDNAIKVIEEPAGPEADPVAASAVRRRQASASRPGSLSGMGTRQTYEE
jgi:hypothetical protein